MPAKEKTSPEQAVLSAVQHPLRKELLRLYVKEAAILSPKELSDFTKQPLSAVGYHVRALADYGAVKLVDSQQRRGAIEHFYEATSLVDKVPWARAVLGLEARR